MTTYYIGIDIGSTCAKTVVLAETEEIALSFVLPTGWSSVDTAEEIRRRLCEAGYDPAELALRVYRLWTGFRALCPEDGYGDHVPRQRSYASPPQS